MNFIDHNIIKEFLLDTYLIDNNLKIRQNFKQCSNENEKKQLYHHFLLNNLFLVRRCHDPGFYAYILDKVNKNEKIKETVKKYVYKLTTSNSSFEQDLFGSFSFGREEKLFDKEVKNPISCPFSPATTVSENLYNVNENSLNYFAKRLEYSIDRGQEDEVLVISQLINDYKSGNFSGYQIFSEDTLYGEQVDSFRWLYSQNQYILENIKFSSHYLRSFSFSIYNLLKITPHDVTFEKELLKIITDLREHGEYSAIDSLKDYSKYINDAFSVASLIWFNMHTEKEKISILNSEYPYHISKKELDEYEFAFAEHQFKDNSKNNYFELMILANELHTSYFFEEAKNVWEFILERTDKSEIESLYSLYDNLATTLREIGNYEESLKYYIKSLELARELSRQGNIDQKNSIAREQFSIENNQEDIFKFIENYVDKNSNYNYKVAIELKNIGEMYYKLGKTEIAEEYFLKAEEKSFHLSPDERTSIFFNLACANRRLSRFDEEFKYLLKILSEDRANPDAEKLALDRVSVLNSIEFMLPDGKFDSRKLVKIDAVENARKLSIIGQSLFHSFQFTKSMDFFENEYEIESFHGLSCFDSLNYIVTYNLYNGNLQKAKILCQELVKNTKDSVPWAIVTINIGLMKIKENNFDDGLKQLEASCDFFCQYPDGIKEFIITIIESAIIFWSKEDVKKIIYSLEKKIVSKKVNFNLVVGCAYVELGFPEDALYFFDKGLFENTDSEIKSLLLYNKGLAFSGIGKANDAIQIYQESIHYLNSVYAWESQAKEYRNKLDALKAKKCIEEAIKLASGKEKERLEEIKQKLDLFSSKGLTLSSVKDKDIRKTLYSAEKLMISDVKKMDDIDKRDFSTALHYYGKALENMLDRHISSPIRQSIYEDFGDCVVEDYKRFRGKDFPPYLKYMLDKNNKASIGPSGWRKILHYVSDKSDNPVYQRFKDELIKQYTTEEIEKIKFACGMIASYRNDSVHQKVKSYSDVIIVRKKIVSHLNNVIYILYQ